MITIQLTQEQLRATTDALTFDIQMLEDTAVKDDRLQQMIEERKSALETIKQQTEGR